jgi:hypothetical protein
LKVVWCFIWLLLVFLVQNQYIIHCLLGGIAPFFDQTTLIMKGSRTILVALLLVTAAGLFAQTVEKTFVRSFNLQGAQEAVLQFDGPVEVKTWNQSIARIQMTVGLERGSDSMLRSLAQAGRYNLKGQLENDQYLISVPGLNREVSVNGQTLAENITYVVFVPEDIRVNIENSTSAAGF